MYKSVARILYTNNLGVLARAYLTTRERLGDIGSTPIDKINVAALNYEQCCDLDIAYAVDRLVLRIDNVTAEQKARLNESAARFLDKVSGAAPINSWPLFDPDFELSCVVRHVAIVHSQIAA